MSVLHLLLATALVFYLPAAELRREESRRSASSSSNSRSKSSRTDGSGSGIFVTTDGGEVTTLPPISPTTEVNPTTTIDPMLFCSMVFDNIGPFCQFVVQDGTCLPAFSNTTCESCVNIVNSCGITDSSICDSSLVSTCPQTETFLMEYCTVVDGVCTGIMINDHVNASGSGDVVVPSGSGDPEDRSRTDEGSRSRSDSVAFTTALPTTASPTTMAPSGSPPIPLSNIESLTAEQRANIVPLGFRGINVQQFTQNLILATFREEFANIANMYFSGSRITKRQQQPFTDQYVFVLDTLSENEGVLTVRVVVGGGQEGQSAPVISSNDMAMLLQINGPRLALVLSSVTNLLNVEYVDLIGRMLATTTASPAAVITPPTDTLLQLSNNATIGIVIGGVVAVVLIAAFIVIVVIGTVRFVKSKRRKQKEEELEQHVPLNYIEVTPIEDNGSFSSSWEAMSENARGEYIAVPTSFKV